MKGRDRAYLVSSLVAMDALAIGGALLLAYWLRIGSGLLPYHAPHDFRAYLRVILIIIPIWLLIFAANRLYDHHHLLGGPQEYANVFKACTFGTVGLTVLSFMERNVVLSRSWFLISWILSILVVGTTRFFFRRIVFRLRRRGLFVTRTIIAGVSEQARAIAAQLGSSNSGTKVVGFVDDFLPPGTRVMEGLEVLGSPKDLASLAAQTEASEVIVIPNAVAWETFQEIMESASSFDGFEVKLSPGFYEILTTGVEVTHKGFVPLLIVNRMRITGIDAVLKSALDYGLGTLSLVLLAPLMGLIALLIKLTSSGPILERHPVLGCGGKTFHTLKFRTGLPGSPRSPFANPLPSPINPGAGYPLGRLLYQTGLDKLPQLFNVVAGQMSLVGPRTISVGNGDACRRWLPNLLTVKPGLTGPWIMAGGRSLEDEMRLNMYYIRNWTIWLDLQILFHAVQLILRRERPKIKAMKSMTKDR